MRFILLFFALFYLNGCAFLKSLDNQPDFDKPLIILPEDRDANAEIKKAKAPEKQVWAEAKTSRIWINPHVDENGDYVEGYYKYIVLQPGHWILNGNQTTQQ